MKGSQRKYWKEYYNSNDLVGSDDLQKNIGRSKGGVSISPELWERTLQDIENLLCIDDSMVVLELCCGNGQIIGNLSSRCKRAIGVDFSNILLEQLTAQYQNKVEVIHADIMQINFVSELFDVVLIYFSIQHFNEKETIQIINNALMWLKNGGKLYIGDVPDELKKWEYINKPEYKKDYLKRVLEDTPMIGFWYQQEFFNSLSAFFKNISVRILEQPHYHINSSYRFDVLIEKNY